MSKPRALETGSGAEVEESRPEVKEPPLFKVVLLNDDYTPMEFVVEVLELFFQLDRNKATQIMLHVHTRGKGSRGRLYLRDRGNQGRAGQRSIRASISIRCCARWRRPERMS